MPLPCALKTRYDERRVAICTEHENAVETKNGVRDINLFPPEMVKQPYLAQESYSNDMKEPQGFVKHDFAVYIFSGYCAYIAIHIFRLRCEGGNAGGGRRAACVCQWHSH